MLIVIGSVAAQKRDVDLGRLPKDTDVFCDTNHKEDKWDAYWHPRLLEYFDKNEVRVATIDELYTIKVSHSFWELRNGSWNKHMADQQKLKNAGARFIPRLYSILYKIWEERYGAKVVSLDATKGDFFTDAVTRIYDHDSIHDSVAYGDRPLYESVLKDGETVNIDSRKLWSLDHDTLVKLFREEVCATALERIVIPREYKCSPGQAYIWALRRTMTSLTKGKSALFISRNFEEFRKPCNYVERHLANKHRLIRLENNV